MYNRLNSNRTKSHYREILHAVIVETQLLKDKFPDLTLYQRVLVQLLDIKNLIIDQGEILSEDDIYDRYSLGTIAAKNFVFENDSYAQKLSDVFGGAFDYFKMPE